MASHLLPTSITTNTTSFHPPLTTTSTITITICISMHSSSNTTNKHSSRLSVQCLDLLKRTQPLLQERTRLSRRRLSHCRNVPLTARSGCPTTLRKTQTQGCSIVRKTLGATFRQHSLNLRQHPLPQPWHMPRSCPIGAAAPLAAPAAPLAPVTQTGLEAPPLPPKYSPAISCPRTETVIHQRARMIPQNNTSTTNCLLVI
mmetsp:Transcript_3838/g.6781  ORF Transcript_3838/g.6781 Transcript_3838/m.6781 type:complete len:201 (+) Transcript_3838:427-1029(+)